MTKVKTNLATNITTLISKFNELSNDFGDISLLVTGDSDLVTAFNNTLGSEADMIVSSVTADSGFYGHLIGLADRATILDSARDFSMSGDISALAISFNGSTDVSLVGTIGIDKVDSDNILAASISTVKVQDDAITRIKIPDNAINANKIDSGSITAIKVAVDAITEEKMANDAIGQNELKSVVTLIIYDSAGSPVKTMYGAGA